MKLAWNGSSSVVAIMMALGWPAATNAQAIEADAQLEEIVVTAQKRAESIQDVPLSIVAASGKALEMSGVRSAGQLAKIAPSLKIDQSAGASDLRIRIRGFGSPGATATDPAVAAYMNGSYLARPGILFTSFLDIASVEVLSGPQGTLFGRNASMGAISVTTNAPSTGATTAEVKAEAGSYGTFSGTVIANIPAGENVALRFAGNATHTDGIFHNRQDGKTYGKNNAYIGRLSLKWEAAPNLSVTLTGDAAKSDGDGVYTFTGAPNATPGQVAAFTSLLAAFGRTPPVLTTSPSRNVNQVMGNPFLRDRNWGAAANIDWQVSPIVNARLISSYRDWDNKQRVMDSIGTTLRLLNVYLENRSQSQSHELQLVSDKGAFLDGKLSLTAGAYYGREKYHYGVAFNLGAAWCPILFSAVAAACSAGPQERAGFLDFDQTSRSLAFYTQANYRILPALELALGARYTWDRKSASLLTTVPNAIGVAPLARPESHPNLRFKDDRPSFRASLSWDVTDQVMVFGTFSTGYKSGGFNSGITNAPLTPALRTFASETVKDWQLGVKSKFLDGRARFNATLFRTTLDNFQDRSFNGTAFIIRNSGDVRSQGVDLDGEVVGPAGLHLSFGATYLDAKYVDNSNAPGREGCTGTPTCPLVQDLSGAPVPYASDWQGYVGVGWTSPAFGDGHKVTVRATQNFTSSFLSSNTNNPSSKLAGYSTTDVLLSVAADQDRWRLDLFGTNIFDKRYFVSTTAQILGALFGVNDPATGATLYRGFTGDPARYGVRLALKY